MNYLIVGGSSVSGQAVIKSINKLGPDHKVISTSSSPERQVEGAQHTIGNIDLADRDAVDKIIAGINGENIDYMVYVPARGAVGMPSSYATAEQIDESLDYSFRPILRLTKALNPKMSVCFSGFVTTAPLMQIYGAMTFSKVAMEECVIRNSDKLKCIRIGMFPSKSVRGIALLVQKNIQRGDYSELDVLRDEWKASGVKKFTDFFYQKNYVFEESTFKGKAPGEFRPTTPEDIGDTVVRALSGEEKAPIINLLGAWVWPEEKLSEHPELIKKMHNLIPTDLDKIL